MEVQKISSNHITHRGSQHSTHRGLVGIQVVRVTSEDIIELHKDNPIGFRTIQKFLPKWVLNTEYQNIQSSDGYLQFVGEGFEGREYICFDVQFSDDLVQEEMIAIGTDDFLEGAYELIKSIEPIPFKDYHRSLGNTKYLLVEINYTGSYDWHSGGYECDVEYNWIKVLNLSEV